MWWTSFRISNYKSILDVSVDLDIHEVTTLFGINGSGKTAILGGMDLFRRAIMKPLQGVQPNNLNNWEQDIINIGSTYDLNVDQIIRELNPQECLPMFAENDTIDTTLEGYFLMSSEGKGLLCKLFSIPDEVLFGTKKNPLGIRVVFSFVEGKFVGRKVELLGVDVEEEKKELLLEVFSHVLPEIFHFDQHKLITEVVYLEEERRHAQSKNNRVFSSYFLKVLGSIAEISLGGSTSIAKILHMMQEKVDTESALKQINEDLSKLSVCLNERISYSWETVFKGKAVHKIILQADVPNRSILVMAEIFDYRTSISHLSSGVKEFLALMLFTYLRGMHQGVEFDSSYTMEQSIDSFKKWIHRRGTLLLFDEPGVALHEGAQTVIIDRFESMVAEGRMLLYSTHNHSMVKPEWLECAYVVQGKIVDLQDHRKVEVTECIPYKSFTVQYPGETTYFQPLLEVVGHKGSVFGNFSGVYITEGKTDFYLLHYFADVIFKDYPPYQEIRISPAANGASGLGNLISFYLGQGLKFKVILDGDEAGLRAKKIYLKDYPLEEDQVVCVSDIDPSFADKTPEMLISEDDKINIQRNFFPNTTKYDKQKFHAAVNRMFATKRGYSFSKETLENMTKLLNFLLEGTKTM